MVLPALSGKNSFQINLESMQPGIYLLQLLDEKGNAEILRVIKAN
jgi:hypothetical protein